MPHNIEDKFNPLMPESDDRALCIRIEKPISPEGYEQNLIPRLKDMLDKHDEIRLLAYYKEYKGWEPDATTQDMEATLVYGGKFRKFALVNAPEKEIFRKKMKQPLIAGEMRFFAEEDLSEALAWVKS